MPQVATAYDRSDLTLVVLVHNGEATIGATLEGIAAQRRAEWIRLLIVCNGCRDASAEKATEALAVLGAAGIRANIIELPAAGRAEALNAVRPQIEGAMVVLDQDAILSPGALAAILTAFRSGVRFATLHPRVEHSRSFLVRAYYRFWAETEYVRRSPSSIGLYAVSADGLGQMPDFPPIHSDDKFARLYFRLDQRCRIDSEWYRVGAPQSFGALLRNRIRYNRGNRELARLIACGTRLDAPRRIGVGIALSWRRWGDGIIFAAVLVLSFVIERAGLTRAAGGRRQREPS